MSQKETDWSSSDGDQLDGEPTQVTMALHAWKGSVGCAYHNALEATLYIMEDCSDISGRHDFAGLLLQQVLPAVILLSSAVDEALRECVQRSGAPGGSSSQSDTGTRVQQSPTLITKPARDFNAKAGFSALTHVEILANRENRAPSERRRERSHTSGQAEKREFELSKLARLALVNPETSQLSLSALAVLLSHLDRTTSRTANTGGVLVVNNVKTIKVDKFMHLGADALTSLQIFDQEAHANLHFSNTKEGLSLYGTLNECVTYSGKLLLKSWLIRPSTEAEVIRARQDGIECLLKNENVPWVEKMRRHLRGVGNINQSIMIISSGKARVGDWLRLLKAIRSSREVHRCFSNVQSSLQLELFEKVRSLGFDEVGRFAEKVNGIIDWQDSKLQGGRLTILPGVDEQLDEYREKYAGLESQLSHLAEKLSTKAAFQLIPNFSINYFPQIGYLCTIPRRPDWEDSEVFTEGGWQFQFATDTEVHYKNDYMRDLDHFIGDLTTAISDREIEIIHTLEEELMEIAPTLLNTNEAIAELDCILSLAYVSFHREWVRPNIIEGKTIQIFSGRHPLVEGCVETCISNDTFLADTASDMVKLQSSSDMGSNSRQQRGKGHSMLVVTGANFSGKSVYLKQVGVIVILAQIGCFVPAAEATIGIHDAIFTRVTTTESVARASSAFMIDLEQISFMLRNCTSRSILLIDEFGKGTDSLDGQALFCSLIEHLTKKGASGPIVVMTTHFHEIFTNGYLPLDLPIDYGHMAIVASSATGVDVDTIPTYLYKLEPGLLSASFALGCAALSEVPKHVRLRAGRVSQLLSRFEILELLDVCIDDEERERLTNIEKAVRRFVGADFSKETCCSGQRQDWKEYLSQEILLDED